ncbi:uncharacterized protein LOC121260135 [Juglans microcarpa x Juglans regia]|uniref:uncharacterized protein LOC121260135 n=1 Tax=Juglans microcarpa x Juglans regia TaxID=2249226 RepID=UPI001B7F5602|nr:uncharacterized protein LOC121260135 [Juglans microcarpa x Juglans regia]
MESKIIQEFAMVASKIWWRRNNLVFKCVFAHPKVIVQKARSILDVLNEELGCSSSKVCTSAKVWQAPPSNWLKTNWDSAIDKARGIIGVGVVVRDSTGKIIATMRTKKHLFPDPLLAESFGALKIVQFGLKLGLTKVIIEGDSLQVINSLRRDKEGCNSATMFVCEAKQLLENFAKWEVSHVRRNGNSIAHLLAKDALSNYDHIVTLEDLPPLYPFGLIEWK